MKITKKILGLGGMWIVSVHHHTRIKVTFHFMVADALILALLNVLAGLAHD